MQPVIQVPGVYIVEQNAFPNSVVEVATAIPAFIGYTEKAVYKGRPLHGVPTKIGSLQEFEDRFGGAFKQVFDLVLAAPIGTITGGTISTGSFIPSDVTAATLSGVDIATATITDATVNGVTTGTITGSTQKEVAVTGATVTDNPITDGTLNIGTGTTSGGTVAAPAGSDQTVAGKLPSVHITFDSGSEITLTPQGTALFYLYNSVKLFYLNGGCPCYIVSAGGYDASPDPNDFTTAIDSLEAEQDPTMLLCPDALMLDSGEYAGVMQHMLQHCEEVQKRVALFDVYGGTTPGTPPTLDTDDDIDNFRDAVQNYLNYGIAYFPWLNTTVVTANDLSFDNLSAKALTTLAGLLPTPTPGKPAPSDLFASASSFQPGPVITTASSPEEQQAAATQLANKLTLHNKLIANSPEYGQVLQALATYLSVLPAAPAMAGVYTTVDANRGVWKAPANVGLNAVVSPTVAVSDSKQANLNVDAMTGKSINVIRAFKGLGTLVWGARTLDGNSQDWRYINVRRTMIMIEQSVKLAARNTVFEPNDANTWTTFKSMLESFLFNLWKQGALAGTAPADAYQVQVGLGTTMTGNDILDGIMRVNVLVALVRPAEFIVVTFQQEMQKS